MSLCSSRAADRHLANSRKETHMAKRNRLAGLQLRTRIFSLPPIGGAFLEAIEACLGERLDDPALQATSQALGEYSVAKRYLSEFNASPAEDRARLRVISEEAGALAEQLITLYGDDGKSPVWKRLVDELLLSSEENVSSEFGRLKFGLQPGSVQPQEIIGLLHHLGRAADIDAPQGRPPMDAERELVEKLADIFEDVTGLPPKRWFDVYGKAESGRFLAFCKAAIACLPGEEQPSTSLTGIVRSVCNDRMDETPDGSGSSGSL